MLRAKIINENTIDTITELNDGVRPDPECFEEKTYFVYSDEENVPNNIMTDEAFHAMYRFDQSGSVDNTIEKI